MPTRTFRRFRAHPPAIDQHAADVARRACRYDFLIDADYHPWLLEINCSPTMEHSTPVTKQLVRQLSEDVVKVTVDVLANRSRPRPPAAAAPPDAAPAATVDSRNRDEEFLFGRSGGNATLAFRATFAGVDTGNFTCSFRDAPVAGGGRRSLLAGDDLTVVGAPLKLPPALAPRAARPRPGELHTATRERSASPDVATSPGKPMTPPHVVTSPSRGPVHLAAAEDGASEGGPSDAAGAHASDPSTGEAAAPQHRQRRTTAPVHTSARRRSSEAAFQSTVVTMVAGGDGRRLSSTCRADSRQSDGTRPSRGSGAAGLLRAPGARGLLPPRDASARRQQKQREGVLPPVCSITLPTVESVASAPGLSDAPRRRGGQAVLMHCGAAGAPPAIAAGLPGDSAPLARACSGVAPHAHTADAGAVLGARLQLAPNKSAVRARVVRRLQSATSIGSSRERQAAVQHMQQALLGRILEQVDALAPPATPQSACRASVGTLSAANSEHVCAGAAAPSIPVWDGSAPTPAHCGMVQGGAVAHGSGHPPTTHAASQSASTAQQPEPWQRAERESAGLSSPGPRARRHGADAEANSAKLALVTLDCSELAPEAPVATLRAPRATGVSKRSCAPLGDTSTGAHLVHSQQVRALAGLGRSQSVLAACEDKKLSPAPACINLDRGSSPFVREMQRRYEARGGALVAQRSMPRVPSEYAAAADPALQAGVPLKRGEGRGHADADVEAWTVNLL